MLRSLDSVGRRLQLVVKEMKPKNYTQCGKKNVNKSGQKEEKTISGRKRSQCVQSLVVLKLKIWSSVGLCASGVLRVCSGCTTYVCAWRNENGKANISTFKWTTHREPLESLDERSEIELNVRSSERNQRRQLSLHVRQWPKEREREREGKNVQTNANSERWNPNNKVLNFGFQLQEDRPKGNQLRKMLTVVDAINTRIWLQLGTKERQT